MNKKAVLVTLAVLMSLLLQASGEVNVNVNVPGHSMGGASSQEAINAKLQDRVREMEGKLLAIPDLKKQNADLTDKLTDLQKKLSDVTTELWLNKKACCNKTLVCPGGYVQFLDRCYKSYGDKKNFTDAKSACQAAGGHLAMPKDKPTNDFLLKQAPLQSGLTIWLGLTDKVTEGTWVWEDGTPLGSWNNWGQGQPAHSYPDLDCAQMAPMMQWFSNFCSFQAYYMCELSATVYP
ncbi:perlucin-like protein [Branchiostoma floridae x Branchiostoma belcheri]